MQENDFAAVLRALHDAGIDFILVGGLSAVVNGAPIHSYDVDIVHARDVSNIRRVDKMLDSLEASPSHLAGSGHLNLMTKFGPLDLLGTIGHDLDYLALLPHSPEKIIADGVTIRVLDLETLIAIKEDLGGEKDRAMLPILRRTLEEQRRQKQKN